MDPTSRKWGYFRGLRLPARDQNSPAIHWNARSDRREFYRGLPVLLLSRCGRSSLDVASRRRIKTDLAQKVRTMSNRPPGGRGSKDAPGSPFSPYPKEIRMRSPGDAAQCYGITDKIRAIRGVCNRPGRQFHSPPLHACPILSFARPGRRRDHLRINPIFRRASQSRSKSCNDSGAATTQLLIAGRLSRLCL